MNAQPNGTFLLHDFLLKSDLILKKDEKRTILFTFFNLQQCIKFSEILQQFNSDQGDCKITSARAKAKANVKVRNLKASWNLC